MPMLKRQQFVPIKPPADLKPDEEVFYLKLTNEIFRDYDEYFDRMIVCNSLVWSCSLTGKGNLTFQEALDSEKAAKKLLKGFPKGLKKALFYLVTLTKRGKVLDVYEDIFAYARERYFKDEVVLSVIGKLWCPSRVTRVIYPTKDEIETYRQEQIAKGEYERNDYLKDDSWGPPPDLFRYEVVETDPDNPTLNERHVLEAIDVKREKTVLTRDKCRYLLKLATEYDEKAGYWRIKDDVAKALGLHSCRFEDIFVGPSPKFDYTPAVVRTSISSTPSGKSDSSKKAAKGKGSDEDRRKSKEVSKKEPKAKASKKDVVASEGKKKQRAKSLDEKSTSKKPKATTNDRKSGPAGTVPAQKERKKPGPKPKKEKEEKEKKLSPQELKQIELERKAQEREKVRRDKKLIADFKKLWFKPKEDLEVEDLKDLPPPDPVSCRIPNHLFGDFVAVLEYFNCYSNILKVRDCFSNGLTFDLLEKALVANEVAGPFSDIIQLLLRTIFRLQEAEQSEISHDTAAAVELDVDECDTDVSAKEAIRQATAAATWSTMYQNTPLNKLNLDHLTLTEVLRLHLLSSGALPSEKDVKWRYSYRGCYDSFDDPGLRLRIEEPQIIKTLSHGSVFDLSMAEKLKVLMCLIGQMLTFYDVREAMEDSFEQFKQSRLTLRSLQAAEKRKETEDQLWKAKLRQDRVIPDPNSLKVEKEKNKEQEGDDKGKEPEKPNPPPSNKPLLTDEEIEALIEKKDKEIAKRKQETLWKEAELLDAMNKHERKLGIHPIGRDRAYRRYWIFNTVAGIFVEHDDEYVGTCLPSPTPYLSDVNLNDVNFVRENFDKLKQIDKEGSDKENSTIGSPKKSPKKKQASSKSRDVPSRPEVFGICSGDPTTCSVHSTSTARPKWYFYWSAEQLDGLIEGLTSRGIREKELKQLLTDEKEGLQNILKRCPVTKLNKDKDYPEYMLSIAERKAQRQPSSKHLDPNLNYPSGTPVDKILELQLRDLILEMEEKVYLGTLGSLKVKDRQSWRKAIESGGYDMQQEDLTWGKNKSSRKEREKSQNERTQRRESKEEDGESTTGTSSSGLGENRPVDIFPSSPDVKDLACAILQFRQSIEPKFFKRPLGIGKDEGKGKNKSSGVEGKAADLIKGTSLSPLERWELSLMASTSLSQLFMHLFTLDNSIEWSRSVLNARCRICRRKGDPDNMLLCDECNKGHHAYCLKPPLQVIPKGDWFCSECRPPEPPPKISRRQRKEYLSDDEIGEELEKSDEEEEADEGDNEREGSERSKAQMNYNIGPMDLENSFVDTEVCEVCGFGGQVICCDKCPRLYHLQCLDPPKTRVPRGSWYCPHCSGSGSSASKSKNKGKSNTKGKGGGKKRRVVRNSSSSDEEEDEESEIEETAEESQDTDDICDDDETNEENGHALQNGYSESNSEKGSDEEDEEEEEERPKVKVKFGPSSSKVSSGYGTRSSGGPSSSSGNRNRKFVDDSEEYDSDFDDEKSGRSRKRKSASAAAERIAQVAKRLRSDSKENEDSENSNDSGNGGKRKRYTYDDSDESSDERTGESAPGGGPKRTRLQRMNTNQCSQNGELDNVLLDRLLKDVMKHVDAWPFLKPVSKVEVRDRHLVHSFLAKRFEGSSDVLPLTANDINEPLFDLAAPDYHEIVKEPMDLGTIKYKLNSMVYTCNEEFISDLMLVFSNCSLYNHSEHPVSKAGESLKQFCLRRLKKIGIYVSDEIPTSLESSLPSAFSAPQASLNQS